jgi:hypothetical protein
VGKPPRWPPARQPKISGHSRDTPRRIWPALPPARGILDALALERGVDRSRTPERRA